MLKNILNLEGAQKLTKNEQKGIKGGLCYPFAPCAEGYTWSMTKCDCLLDKGHK